MTQQKAVLRRTPEQDLINQFVAHLKQHTNNDLKTDESKIINYNCKSKKYADVEFISENNLHWVIEAKSDDSKDKYNTVHKIFGELLKETGRTNRTECRHGILIPDTALAFYSRAFQAINYDKFMSFGRLIPVDAVFTCDANGIRWLTWEALYHVYSVKPMV